MDITLTTSPRDLQFETNTNCNGRCVFCEYPKMKRHGTAKWSDLLDLIYRVVPHVEHVTPFGMQEPLLEPRLTAILSNVKQQNQKAETLVYSNMTMYDPELYERIIKQQCLDKLCVSFYGTTKKVYGQLQPGFDYVQTQKNIKAFVKLRRKLGWRKPRVHMHLLVVPETVPRANQFMRKWRSIVDEAGFVRKDSFAGTKPYDPILEMRLWGNPAKARTPCFRLWTNMVVRFDGTVVACCLDAHNQLPVGNAFKDGLEAFNSLEMQRLRQLHVEGKQSELALCKDCSVWRYEHSKEWNQFWFNKKNVCYAEVPSTKS